MPTPKTEKRILDIKKRVSVLSPRNLQPFFPKSSFVKLSQLRESVVSEYMSEDMLNERSPRLKNYSPARQGHIKDRHSVDFANLKSRINSDLTINPSINTNPRANKFKVESINRHKYSIESLTPKAGDEALLSNWSLNAMDIEMTEQIRLIWYMLDSAGLMKEYDIPLQPFLDFVIRIREAYNEHNNSFHNFDHGFCGELFFNRKYSLLPYSHACRLLPDAKNVTIQLHLQH
jgi:hypothetical protein